MMIDVEGRIRKGKGDQNRGEWTVKMWTRGRMDCLTIEQMQNQAV